MRGRGLAAALFVLLAFVLFAGTARADDPLFADTANPEWVARQATYGGYAGVIAPGPNGTLFLGGTYAEIGPFTGGFGLVDRTSGDRNRSLPKTVGVVDAIADDGAGGWFVGGLLRSVGGMPVGNLAHIRADGSVDLGFQPSPDDEVRSLLRIGSTLYVGGAFGHIAGRMVRGLAALDTAGGEVRTDFGADVDYPVLAMATDGQRLFVGGYFNDVNGVSMHHLAALDPASGALAWSSDPGQPDGKVYALAVQGSTLYVGGSFTELRGAPRVALGAVDTATGAPTAWNPQISMTAYPPATVGALALSGSTVYVGGHFDSAGGQARTSMAAFDLATGGLAAWNPQLECVCYDFEDFKDVWALGIAGGTVYVGGAFFPLDNGQSGDFDGQPRSMLAAVDTVNGALESWDPHVGPEAWQVRTLAVDGGRLAIGGSFSTLGGRHPCNTLTCSPLVQVDPATGDVTSWDVGADAIVYALVSTPSALYAGGEFSTLGGLARPLLGAVDPLTGSGIGAFHPPTIDSTFGIDELEPSGSLLYATGPISSVGGQARHGFAAFDASTGAAQPFNPAADIANGYDISVRGGTAYISGQFDNVSGQARSHLAAVDSSTGALQPWNPAPDGYPLALAAPPAGPVYAAGTFTHIGGAARSGVAALDPSTGAATSWDPAPDADVEVVAPAADRVYVGGGFGHIGGAERPHLAALDTTTGSALPWNPRLNGGVTRSAILVDGHTVWAAAGFQFHPPFQLGSQTSGFYGFPDQLATVHQPTLSGTPAVGQTLTCTADPRDAGLNLVYTWRRSPGGPGALDPITNAVGPTYVVRPVDGEYPGSDIACRVYAGDYVSKQGGAWADSERLFVSFAPPPQPPPPPSPPPPPPPPPPRARCVVPRVVGKSLAKAKRAIRSRHCRTGTIRRSYSARIRTGRVISQRPRPGRVLRSGSKVNLVVSRGRRPHRR